MRPLWESLCELLRALRGEPPRLVPAVADDDWNQRFWKVVLEGWTTPYDQDLADR
jgi:hypothetical protein